uniref:uncharacterized protein LOC117261458 n=1 Tax=Epinephelus lanceolatus TaxID=310571 RepID=UPI001447A7B7|nr:uncharacterized protein LOC117261458 [Epinephelus lanceolatus]
MILLWVTLLVLHQGYTLVPVTTAHLGQPVNLSCALPHNELIRRVLYWYKQSVGDALKLIVTVRESKKPEYAPEFSDSRVVVNHEINFFNLTIMTTFQEDEGMYHCAVMDWLTIPIWSGTYLLLKGSTHRTSDYIVDQWPPVYEPDYLQDPMLLQCSVLSDSDNKTCPGDHSVFWFRAALHEFHPDIIYTDGNRHHECERTSEPQKSCVYRFSKMISSYDFGTYYCAVATCGQILFGDISKLQMGHKASFEFIGLVIASVCLVISIIGNIVFICYLKSRSPCSQLNGIESATLQERHDNSSQPDQDTIEGRPDQNYAALHFSGNKATRGRKKKELKTEESVYSQVKCSV